MARADLLSRLYLSSQSALEFNFDALQCNYNIFNIFSVTDIGDINYITTSVKYMGDVKTRIRLIEDLMKRRSFKKYHAGTNRQVYVFLDDRTFVAKTPIDHNGMKDNILEYGVNTEMDLKPSISKMFQTTQNGEMAFCEKVDPIQTKEEFLSVADDIFYMLIYKILGKYIMDDIGTLKFMNYGIRRGWGPVILDYAKTFKLDGNKLTCNKEVYPGIYCNGEIDYDEGFNNIVCKCCGTHYNAMDLADLTNQHKIILSKGDYNMNIRLRKGNTIIVDSSKNPVEVEVIKRKESEGVMSKLIKTGESKGPVFEDDKEETLTTFPVLESKYIPEEETVQAEEVITVENDPPVDEELDINCDEIPYDEDEVPIPTEGPDYSWEQKDEPVEVANPLPDPLKNLQEMNSNSTTKSSFTIERRNKNEEPQPSDEVMNNF